MSGMFENQPPLPNQEAPFNEYFNTPPNPFTGEVPAVELLVNEVLVEATLMEYSKSMPFVVPQHYWDTPINMPTSVPKRLSATWISLLQAACIVLLLSIGFLPVVQKNQSTSNKLPFSGSVSVEDAQWYLENQTLNNDIAWLEWEEKLLNEETAQPLNLFHDLSPDDVKNFF